MNECYPTVKKTIAILYLLLIGQSIAIAQSATLKYVKTLGATSQNVDPVTVNLDSNKSIFISARFSATLDVDPGPANTSITSNGSTDFFLAKYDTLGRFIWVKQWGGVQGDASRRVAIDANGNLFITGFFQSTMDMDPGPSVQNITAVGANTFLIKLDPAGNFVWAKTFPIFEMTQMSVDGNNNIIMAGSFAGTFDFDPGPAIFNMTAATNTTDDLFLLKLNNDGNFLWAKQMTNLNASETQQFGLKTDAANNIIFAGNFTSSYDFDPGAGVAALVSNGANDAFIVKLNSDGIFNWVKQFGGPETEKIFAIDIDQDGAVYSTGQFGGTVDFDPGAGNQLLTASSIRNCFIAKLDANGNFSYAKNFQTGTSFGLSLALDQSKNVYLAGGFYGPVDFDPSAAQYLINEGHLFNACLDANGNFRWAAGYITQIVGGYETSFSGLAVDRLKNVYYSSQFPFAVDFDPSAGTNILTPVGSYDLFLLRVNACPASSAQINSTACNSYTVNNITYTNSGTFFQTLTNSLGCDSLIQINLTINTGPSVNLGLNDSICNGETVLLSPGIYNSYLWNDGSTQPTLSAGSTGLYWVEVSDAQQCTARDSIVLFAGNNCTTNCQLNNSSLLYPNPVRDNLTINKNPTSCIVYFNLYNALGQVVIRNYQLSDGLNYVPLKQLAAGTYFYRMHANNQVLKTGSLVRD